MTVSTQNRPGTRSDHAGTSRRTFVAASAALAAGLGARRFAVAQSSPATDGPWSFTDDRGRTISLDARPARLVSEVMAGAALWDYGISSLGYYGGTIKDDEGNPTAVAGRLPVDEIEFAGADMENLDLELITSLNPDVLIGTSWDPNPDYFGGYDESALGGLPKIAPTLAIRVVQAPVDVPLQRFIDLATALGADMNAPAVVEAKAAFEAARDDVQAAAAEKPGLKVAAIFANIDGLYIANPTVSSDLMYFTQLGVEFVVPTDPGEDMGGYWEQLSWEQATKYKADLYLLDDRPTSFNPEQLLDQPSFGAIPGISPDQIGPWSIEYVISYQGLTTVLQALATSIRTAQILPK